MLKLSRNLAIGFLLLALAVLSACSSLYDVRKLTLPNDPEALQRRLHDIGLPLLAAAVGWCPFEQEATYGFFLENHPRKGGGTSRGVTGPIVSYVHPRLPAAQAGLVLGIISLKSIRRMSKHTTRTQSRSWCLG